MKCYDKAFGKTICPRFFSKKPTNENCIAENEEPFEMIATGPNIEITVNNNRNDDVISVNSATSSSTTRNLVSNFFSGIRQRRNQNQESQQQTGNSFNILNTFNMSRNRPNVTLKIFN